MTQDPIRHFVVLKLGKERESILRNYFGGNSEWITSYVAEKVYREGTNPPFSTVALPSADVHLDDDKQPYLPKDVVVALSVFGNEKLQPEDVVNDIIRAAAEKQDIFGGSSPDLAFATADHWCSAGGDSIFSDRAEAEQLLGVDYLRTQNRTSGKGVNVVVVDQGLDKTILGASYGGGWSVGSNLPGTPRPHPGSVGRSHGMMIAHNILKVAPEATLWDLPLAPPRIANIQTFLSLALAAYDIVLADIANWRTGQFPGPWILVNPWGIFDRKSEVPLGHYTTNPNNPFNLKVDAAVAQDIDVVFAAGNCGQFCPDTRCGEADQGPGRSIWGANSLNSVLTVGAVRADAIWLGYSSQGPGQPLLGPKKPDFCAASQFCEDGDAFTINTGTSAACGLTGGIVAALRSRWNSTTVPPGTLKGILNQTARKPQGLATNPALKDRLGNGILDAKAAFKELKKQFP